MLKRQVVSFNKTLITLLEEVVSTEGLQSVTIIIPSDEGKDQGVPTRLMLKFKDVEKEVYINGTRPQDIRLATAESDNKLDEITKELIETLTLDKMLYADGNDLVYSEGGINITSYYSNNAIKITYGDLEVKAINKKPPEYKTTFESHLKTLVDYCQTIVNLKIPNEGLYYSVDESKELINKKALLVWDSRDSTKVKIYNNFFKGWGEADENFISIYEKIVIMNAICKAIEADISSGKLKLVNKYEAVDEHGDIISKEGSSCVYAHPTIEHFTVTKVTVKEKDRSYDRLYINYDLSSYVGATSNFKAVKQSNIFG